MATVRPGDVVVDAGAGSGILAFFAADAGASRVYAIERDPIHHENMKANIRRNGYENQITLLQGDAVHLQLPEPVDVIICEMIATGLIAELQVPVMNNLIKYGKTGVRVVLAKFHSFVDLVSIDERFYGQRLKIIRHEYPDMDTLTASPLSDKKMFLAVDLSQPIRKTLLKIHTTLRVNGGSESVINGLRISSLTVFYDGSILDGTYAYSYPLILPLEDIHVNGNEEFNVDFSYRLCGGLRTLVYGVSPVSQ